MTVQMAARVFSGRMTTLCLAGAVLLFLLVLSDPAGAQSATNVDTPVSNVKGETAAAVDPIDAIPSALSQFTTGIDNREPIDQVTFVSNLVRKIAFFSDLRGLQGKTVIHRWIYAGETVAEVPFDVRGPRWRVWSTKDLLPNWVGDWTVEIVTEAGVVIAAETFTYSAPE